MSHLQLGSSVWPLNAASIYQQAEYLAKADRPKEADERFRLALRLVPPGERTADYMLDEWRRSLKDALPLSAAQAYRQRVLVGFGSVGSDYLQAAGQLHLQQARRRLAEDRVDEATEEAIFAQAGAPGDAALAGELVVLFDRAGHKQAADETFERTHRVLAGLAQQYPESAIHQHLLARLAVGSNRRLEEAELYAQRAIAIEPHKADYHGTLAEVHLARGDRQAARASAEAGLKLAPSHSSCAAVLAQVLAP